MPYNILGDLHFHSLHSACQKRHNIGQAVEYGSSCGIGAIHEMMNYSKAAKKVGLKYLAITNHVTNPLTTRMATKNEIAHLFEHIEQIQKLNKQKDCDIKYLTGVEADIINNNGDLSLPSQALKKCAVVIASLHRPTNNLSRDYIVDSYTNAIKNKYVDIIGHLTRFISKLNEDDWKKIIKACEKNKKIVEFNIRSPLSKSVLKLVAGSQIKISLGTDIHPEIITRSKLPLEKFFRNTVSEAKQAVRYLEKYGISHRRIINTYTLAQAIKII